MTRRKSAHRCDVCGDTDEAGPLGACPGCRAPLHVDCLRFAGCARCEAAEELPDLPLTRAGRAHRLGASLLDSFFMLVPALAGLGLGLALFGSPLIAFWLALAGALGMGVVNVGLFLGEGGATLGKKLMGITVLDRRGQLLGWRRALAREFLYKSASTLTLGLGFVAPALHAGAATWHDRALGCQVLEARRPGTPALPAAT